ncbi:hypothetical protein JL101_019675 [Skermanella rosea]|uniref:hypothetical protein n=1 Tax=Skermanella rosea TaxID=1817965 RepID=UPI00193388C7|nr:hypothetical protein [Skermanella rosea]UEM02204.1 hypothetical protein JL101_019675 [Skermanella rosea]
MGKGVLEGEVLSHRTREKLLEAYARSLINACRTVRLEFSLVSYSERELRLALDEADIDLTALFRRRQPADGLSPGKIAGIIAFRLGRFKIVHVAEQGQGHALIHLIQDLAAIYAVQSVLLRADIPGRKVLETAYQMSRRHANQETLGIVFDAIAPSMAA